MSTREDRKIRVRSLGDYIVRYDLRALLEEAKADLGSAFPGAIRLLNQREIASRFRRPRRSKPEAK